MKIIRKMTAIMMLALSICAFASCGPSNSSSSSKPDESSVVDDKQPVTSKDKSIVIENDES